MIMKGGRALQLLRIDRVRRFTLACERYSSATLRAHARRQAARQIRLVSAVMESYASGANGGQAGLLFDVVNDCEFALSHVLNERRIASYVAGERVR